MDHGHCKINPISQLIFIGYKGFDNGIGFFKFFFFFFLDCGGEVVTAVEVIKGLVCVDFGRCSGKNLTEN